MKSSLTSTVMSSSPTIGGRLVLVGGNTLITIVARAVRPWELVTSYVQLNTPERSDGRRVRHARVVGDDRRAAARTPRRAGDDRSLARRVGVVAQHVDRDRHVDIGGGSVVAGIRRGGNPLGQHPHRDLARGLVPVAVADRVGEPVDQRAVVDIEPAGGVLDLPALDPNRPRPGARQPVARPTPGSPGRRRGRCRWPARRSASACPPPPWRCHRWRSVAGWVRRPRSAPRARTRGQDRWTRRRPCTRTASRSCRAGAHDHLQFVTLHRHFEAGRQRPDDVDHHPVAIRVAVVGEHRHERLDVTTDAQRIGPRDRRPVAVADLGDLDLDLDRLADRPERVDRAVRERDGPGEAGRPARTEGGQSGWARRLTDLAADIGGRERVDPQRVAFGVDVVEQHIDGRPVCSVRSRWSPVTRPAPG